MDQLKFGGDIMETAIDGRGTSDQFDESSKNSNNQPQGIIMRILMNVRLPHEQFNAAVRDGSIGSKLNRILDAIKPEAVYFTEQCGVRSAIVIVDLPDVSKIPTLAEPWFLTFEADVGFHVAMTPDDLKKAGLEELGKKWA